MRRAKATTTHGAELRRQGYPVLTEDGLIGRRVSKGDLVRALIALAADDPALHHRVLAELRALPAT